MSTEMREIFVSEFTVPGDRKASNSKVLDLYSSIPPGSRRLVLTPADKATEAFPPDLCWATEQFGARPGTSYAVYISDEIVYRDPDTTVDIVFKSRDGTAAPFQRVRGAGEVVQQKKFHEFNLVALTAPGNWSSTAKVAALFAGLPPEDKVRVVLVPADRRHGDDTDLADVTQYRTPSDYIIRHADEIVYRDPAVDNDIVIKSWDGTNTPFYRDRVPAK
jgi:hypothetical protein